MSPCRGIAVPVPDLNHIRVGQSTTRCSEASLPKRWAKAELSPRINGYTAEGGVCIEALSVVWLFCLLQENSGIQIETLPALTLLASLETNTDKLEHNGGLEITLTQSNRKAKINYFQVIQKCPDHD